MKQYMYSQYELEAGSEAGTVEVVWEFPGSHGNIRKLRHLSVTTVDFLIKSRMIRSINGISWDKVGLWWFQDILEPKVQVLQVRSFCSLGMTWYDKPSRCCLKAGFVPANDDGLGTSAWASLFAWLHHMLFSLNLLAVWHCFNKQEHLHCRCIIWNQSSRVLFGSTCWCWRSQLQDVKHCASFTKPTSASRTCGRWWWRSDSPSSWLSCGKGASCFSQQATSSKTRSCTTFAAEGINTRIQQDSAGTRHPPKFVLFLCVHTCKGLQRLEGPGRNANWRERTGVCPGHRPATGWHQQQLWASGSFQPPRRDL